MDAHLILTLTYVFFTLPKEWDPSVLDYDFTPDQAPLWSTPEVDLLLFHPIHEAFGDFSQRVAANLNTVIEPTPTSGEYVPFSTHDCKLHQLKDADMDWTALRPYFGSTSTENIKMNTFRVNLIMNEYTCYGKGHTIHSSGQIEWFKNSVDDRSVQVGGKQRICTIDGYVMPLTCRGGLMYLSILVKPTDKDLERYAAVHLTGPHEWDPSVLDHTHPSGDGEPPWSNGPDERSASDPNFDEFWDYTQRAIQTLSILDDSSSTLTPCLPSWPTSMNLGPTNMMSLMRPLTMKNSGLILVGSMWTLFRKP